MEQRFRNEAILETVNEERRGFIKKVVLGTAFAVPVIHSFSMDGLKIKMAIGQAGADEKAGFDAAGPDKTGVVKPDLKPKPVSPFK